MDNRLAGMNKDISVGSIEPKGNPPSESNEKEILIVSIHESMSSFHDHFSVLQGHLFSAAKEHMLIK